MDALIGKTKNKHETDCHLNYNVVVPFFFAFLLTASSFSNPINREVPADDEEKVDLFRNEIDVTSAADLIN